MSALSQGYSLIEVMTVLAIMGIVAAFAAPMYQSYVRDARLKQAHAALLQDATFLERFYAQNKTFKTNSTTWPALPVTETPFFTLSFMNVAQGAPADTFRLQAVVKDAQNEPRFLTINQDQIVNICDSANHCHSY